jgi:putative endopeptidase
LVAYGKLLSHLSKDFNVEGLERIVGIERMSANEIIKSRKDDEILMKGSDIQQKYGAVPWDLMFKSALGWTPSEFRNAKILVLSTNWLKYLNRCFKAFTLDTWKLLFSAQLLLHVLPILPPPFDDMEFELFGHRLRGQTEKIPQRRLALRLAQEWLSASLGSAFIKEFVPEIIKRSAFNMANEIKMMAKERAEGTDWLNTATRKKAGRKVDSIVLSVAYPSTIIKDRKTVLHPENLVRNVLDLANMEFNDEISKMNTQLNPVNWEDAVFAVNAYYYNEGNRLILPAGILRWPFFHIEASDGWNFGGLGATVGHEICHAFDVDGKDYDETGNRNPWWSKDEIGNYLEKTKALIKLFNKTTYFGQHLNGELTLGENIADLGGLGISLEALKRRLDNKKITGPERKKQLCDFFTSFAVSWRTKEKREKALQSLFMDVHAPPIARVNNVVSQFDDWYDCFDIKPGHALYKEPSDRIHIF